MKKAPSGSSHTAVPTRVLPPFMKSSQVQPDSEVEDGAMLDRNWKGQFMVKDGDDDDGAAQVLCDLF